MKKRILSAVCAAVMLAGTVCGSSFADVQPVKLSPRASVDIVDGELVGITGSVSGAWLKSQFEGDAVILTEAGNEINDDESVPSDTAVYSGKDLLATVTVPGDATKDGRINLTDVSVMLKKIAKWNTDISDKAADLTRDGKNTLADVSLLLKYIAKWDVRIFDEPRVISVFENGMTEYKLLANDPDTDAKIVAAIKACTGVEIEITDEISKDERIIAVGKNLHEKYGFIDGDAVNDTDVYIDTYGTDVYVTSASDEGVGKCVNFIAYNAFTPELDMSFPKGYTGAAADTEIEYTEIFDNGVPIYDSIKPERHSNTVAKGIAMLEERVKKSLFPDYAVIPDREDTDYLIGEYESDYSEILIGQTDRIESRDAYMSLSAGEYTIRMVGDKLIILGYSDDLTYRAICHFADSILPLAEGKSLALPSDLCIVRKPYDNIVKDVPKGEFEDVTLVGEKLELSCEKWIATEIEFTSDTEYTDPVYTMSMDAVFRNTDSGKVMTFPAFWDGGKTFKVRFALTEEGEWEFYTVCSDTANTGLHHRGGSVTCAEYSGDLPIYRHGFIKTVPGKNYFVYDDGTPFFYLGDTHWSLPLEEIDGYGSVETQKKSGITEEIAEEYGITSQFRYIMDYRAEQGYTVIQSQPLGWWTNSGKNSWLIDDDGSIYTYGVNDAILAKFQEYDRHFAYIAEVGLVHANAQFSCVSALMADYFNGVVTDFELDRLSRYWVARYSAYPVLWTTAQESDNDYYGEDRDTHDGTPENNPWHIVMDAVHKYDPFKHPSTAHQEHWFYTDSTNSSFADREAHTWYAAQYHLLLHMEDPLTWQFLRDYYGNMGSKPVMNYEGRYDHFWVGTYGARAQGWQAFLNGTFGYGYGVQPIWAINWAYGEEVDEPSDELGPYEMNYNWVEGLYAEGGEQVTYIKNLLEKYEWWNLVPCFNGSYYYEPNGWGYSVSSIGNDVYIGYFYGTGENYRGLGTLRSMKDGEYTVTWLNCRTGEYTDTITVTPTRGEYKIPQKPGAEDWVIIVEYAGK